MTVPGSSDADQIRTSDRAPSDPNVSIYAELRRHKISNTLGGWQQDRERAHRPPPPAPRTAPALKPSRPHTTFRKLQYSAPRSPVPRGKPGLRARTSLHPIAAPPPPFAMGVGPGACPIDKSTRGVLCHKVTGLCSHTLCPQHEAFTRPNAGACGGGGLAGALCAERCRDNSAP
jgi:hypothetical protein